MTQAVQELLQKLADGLMENSAITELLASGEQDGMSIGKHLGQILESKSREMKGNFHHSLDAAETARQQKPNPDNFVVKTAGRDRFAVVRKTAAELRMQSAIAEAQRAPKP